MSETFKLDGILEGSKSLTDVLAESVKQVREIESLLGRGYSLAEQVTDGVAKLNGPSTDVLSDREKLSAAFMELETVHNYAAPVSAAWEADCLPHAMLYIQEKYAEGEPRPGCAFWFTERDDSAFGYRGYSTFMKDAYENLPDDHETRVAWIEENMARVGSAEISERLQHNTLVRPLWIYWGGDDQLIITVLRKHGLVVPDRDNPDTEVIYVMPTRMEVQ